MLTNTATGSLQFTHFSKPPRNVFLITQPEADYIATSLPSCMPWVSGTFLHSPFSFLWPRSQHFISLPCPSPAISGHGMWLWGTVLYCVRKQEKRKISQGDAVHPSWGLSPLLRASASVTLAELPWSGLCPGSRQILVLWAQADTTIWEVGRNTDSLVFHTRIQNKSTDVEQQALCALRSPVDNSDVCSDLKTTI